MAETPFPASSGTEGKSKPNKQTLTLLTRLDDSLVSSIFSYLSPFSLLIMRSVNKYFKYDRENIFEFSLALLQQRNGDNNKIIVNSGNNNNASTKRVRQSSRLSSKIKSGYIMYMKYLNKMATNTHECHRELFECNKKVTVKRLKLVLQKWHPTLINIENNHTHFVTASILIEVLKFKTINCTQALKCCKELVLNHKANVNVQSTSMNPLTISACRGMFKVVEFLLQNGADPTVKMKGRFRTLGKKLIKGDFTALEWVQRMNQSELAEGLSYKEREPLLRCIKLLGGRVENDKVNK